MIDLFRIDQLKTMLKIEIIIVLRKRAIKNLGH